MAEAAKLEENKRVVLDFFQKIFNDHNVDAGLEHMRDDYIQHNQNVPGGKEVMREMFKKGLDSVSSDIKRVVAEGDLVVVHHHFKFDQNSLGMVVIDIFRLQDGKLAEHWDSMHPILENPPFPNPVF